MHTIAITHDAVPAEMRATQAIACLERRERLSAPVGRNVPAQRHGMFHPVVLTFSHTKEDVVLTCSVQMLARNISTSGLGVLFNREAEPMELTDKAEFLPLLDILKVGHRVTITIPKPGSAPMKLRSSIMRVTQAFDKIYELGLRFESNQSRGSDEAHEKPAQVGQGPERAEQPA